MRDAGQHSRVGKAGVEHRALVDEVGEPVGPRLLVHLDPGLIALGGEECGQAGADRGELGGGEDAGQRRVAVTVEPVPGLRVDAAPGGPQLGERGRHVHACHPTGRRESTPCRHARQLAI